MKERIARIQDLLGLVNGLYPPALAESWDNVGLQVGDPAMPVSTVLIALDPSAAALNAAVESGAQALLCHHPLLLQPLKRLTPADETGRLVLQAVQQGIAVLAAHTNLDSARDGLNDWLARLLNLRDAVPLAPPDGQLLKLVVFVPAGYEERVAGALYQAGAGHIGNYDCCSFRSDGTGTFRPGADSRPFIGAAGQSERVREIRLETILPRDCVARAVERMSKAHPYEEVAYDLIPLANRRADVGLGRIGRLPESIPLDSFAAQVKQVLGIPVLRLVGDPQRRIAKVAVCGGSGASLLAEARRQGADVLVTGDVKYHEARGAQARGLALLDAGHFATERIMVREMATALRKAAQQRGLAMEFVELQGEEDPFQVV
jgi:dinuclear metal center YbgI/SA1388 family protein